MLKNGLLLLVSFALTLLMVEGVLRQTDYRFLLHPYIDFPDNYFVEDTELGVDMAANFLPAEVRFQGPSFITFTNEFGCFDYDQDLEDGYILIVGDSTAWGYAPLEAKWTTLLGEAAGRQTLKCGVSGTGPSYQLLKARKVIEQSGKRPGMIVVLYDSDNDFNDDAVFPGYAITHGQRVNNLKSLDLRTGELERYTHTELEARYQRHLASRSATTIKGRALQRLKRNSVLVTLLLDSFKNAHVVPASPQVSPGPQLKSRYGFYLWHVDTTSYPWVLEALEKHMGNILALKDLAVAHKAEFVLFSTYLASSGLKGELRQRFAEELPYYLNVGDEIIKAAKGRRTGWRYNGHWNILGNQLAADVMYRYLQDAGLLRDIHD